MRLPRIALFLALALLFGNALVAGTVRGDERGDDLDPIGQDDGGGGDGGQGGGGDGGQGGGGNDDEDNNDEEERDRRPLYTNMLGMDPDPVRDRYEEWGVQPAILVTQWVFDPENTGWWTHRNRTDEWLERVPVDSSDLVCLDWEGGVYEHLKNGVSDPRFAEVVAEMVRLAQYIKSQRPQIQIGYWGVPLSKTWDQNETWREASYALQPVYDVSDVLFIQVYDHRRDDPGFVEDLAEVVRFAMELAQGKPVILYTWHRYHSWTPGYGFSLIPRPEYIAHVRKLLSVEYSGNRAAGAIAWGATSWYYEEAFARDENGNWIRNSYPWGNVRAALRAEMRPGETIDQYIARLHPKIYDRLAAAATE